MRLETQKLLACVRFASYKQRSRSATYSNGVQVGVQKLGCEKLLYYSIAVPCGLFWLGPQIEGEDISQDIRLAVAPHIEKELSAAKKNKIHEIDVDDWVIDDYMPDAVSISRKFNPETYSCGGVNLGYCDDFFNRAGYAFRITHRDEDFSFTPFSNRDSKEAPIFWFSVELKYRWAYFITMPTKYLEKNASTCLDIWKIYHKPLINFG
jgi:hypothetical protein